MKEFSHAATPRQSSAFAVTGPITAAVAGLLVTAAACSTGDDIDAIEQREAFVDDHMDALLADEDALGAFLLRMPKGGDLHSHTSGAVTTEKILQWGAEDGACIDPLTMVASNPCAANTVPMSSALPGSPFYLQMRGAWSMEGFPGTLLEAHQHFFDSFGKFGGAVNGTRSDDSMADVLSQAGRNGAMYVELLQGFGSGAGSTAANAVFQPGDAWDRATLLMRRQQILATPSVAAALAAQKLSIEMTFAGARTLMNCGTAAADPGCDVDARLQVAANRTGSRVAVFGQWVFAYELAQMVPELVGVNLVSPEEHPNSLQFYNDEMFALGVLGELNAATAGRKKVHVSLHAGELIPSVVPSPEDLTFHIRNAIELAGAERIGHGVDVLGETAGAGAADLLADMREANVLVEICLTSNRILLGAAGTAHPLERYLQEGVPMALATDDAGILRNSLTQEHVAAVVDQSLRYRDLKTMARASLEHAFVEGDSLWRGRTAFGADLTVEPCREDQLGAASPSSGCKAFLDANKRAALQWKLETRLAVFEDGLSIR